MHLLKGANGLWLAMLFIFSTPACFAETTERNISGQFFLNDLQRRYMEVERERYLRNKGLPTYLFKLSQPELDALPNLVEEQPVKPPSSVPSQVGVSAIIVNPDGQKTIRVNGQYIQKGLPYVQVNAKKSNAHQANLIVDGKSVTVPIGQTYLTEPNTVVQTYKLQQGQDKPAMPTLPSTGTAEANKPTDAPKPTENSPITQLKQAQQLLQNLKP